MTFTLRQLQEEQKPWVLRNFLDPVTGLQRPVWMPLMGLCEELGELVEAGESSSDVHDALADLVIFAADFCTAMEWDLQTIWDGRKEYLRTGGWRNDEHLLRMTVCVGRLQHHFLKRAQRIRGDAEHHDREGRRWLGHLLFEIAFLGGPELLRLVEETWSRVRQRNWRRDSATGGTNEEPRVRQDDSETGRGRP